MHRAYYEWWSGHLQRRLEMLVFGHAGARALVFPTRCGRFYDYENWGLVQALWEPLAHGRLQLYCVDSVDAESLYAAWRPPQERIARHVHYERYLLEEVLPLSCELNPDPHLIAHGCSLGAYHAVTIAFRHPHLFSKVVAFSGRYDLTRQLSHYRPLFDGYYDETIYFHTPAHFIPGLRDPAILCALRALEIVLAVGADDVFLESNRSLSTALWDQGVWNALQIWPGEAHCAAFWRQAVAAFLP